MEVCKNGSDMKTPMQGQRMKRSISLLTIVFFLVSQVAYANPGAGIEIAAHRETPGFLRIDIPSELATLDGLYEAPSRQDPKLILHIQNAHANYGAQQKIKELLRYLEKNYAMKTIFVEGASEDLNPDYLKMFPDRERNLKLAEFLAKQGELTGAELYLLEADKDHGPQSQSQSVEAERKLEQSRLPFIRGNQKSGQTADDSKNGSKLRSVVSGLQSVPVRAVGIEDAGLYRENYEALRKVFGSEVTVKRYLSGFEGRLSTLASKVFSKDLLKLLGEWKKFEKGHREFMPYVKSLAVESKRVLGVDLESLFSQVEWPQITRLLALQTMEKELDMQKGLTERDQLVQFLKGKKVSANLISGVENFRDQRVTVLGGNGSGPVAPVQPRDLMEQLVTEAGPKGFYFYNYPNFSLYAGYLILKSEMDPKGLFGEIRVLFTRILDKLAETDVSRASSVIPAKAGIQESGSPMKTFGDDNKLKPSLQKALLELYRHEELVRKLLNLELTRKDWQEVLAKKDLLAMDPLVAELKEIGTAVSRESGLPLSNFETKPVNPKFRGEVLEVQTAAYGFYEAARRREDVFYEKIDSVMRKESLNKAVLITGGFHTDGITELLREHEVSYGTLTPRLIEKSDESLYRSVMLQNKAGVFELSYLEAVSRLESFKVQQQQLGEAEVLGNLKPILRAIGYAGNFGDITGAINIFNQSVYATEAGIRIVPAKIGEKNGKPVYQVIRRSEQRGDQSAGRSEFRKSFLKETSVSLPQIVAGLPSLPEDVQKLLEDAFKQDTELFLYDVQDGVYRETPLLRKLELAAKSLIATAARTPAAIFEATKFKDIFHRPGKEDPGFTLLPPDDAKKFLDYIRLFHLDHTNRIPFTFWNFGRDVYFYDHPITLGGESMNITHAMVLSDSSQVSAEITEFFLVNGVYVGYGVTRYEGPMAAELQFNIWKDSIFILNRNLLLSQKIYQLRLQNLAKILDDGAVLTVREHQFAKKRVRKFYESLGFKPSEEGMDLKKVLSRSEERKTPSVSVIKRSEQQRGQPAVRSEIRLNFLKETTASFPEMIAGMTPLSEDIQELLKLGLHDTKRSLVQQVQKKGIRATELELELAYIAEKAGKISNYPGDDFLQRPEISQLLKNIRSAGFEPLPVALAQKFQDQIRWFHLNIGQAPFTFFDFGKNVYFKTSQITLGGEPLDVTHAIVLSGSSESQAELTEFFLVNGIYLGYGVTRYRGPKNADLQFKIFGNSLVILNRSLSLPLSREIYQMRLQNLAKILDDEAVITVKAHQFGTPGALNFYKEKELGFTPLDLQGSPVMLPEGTISRKEWRRLKPQLGSFQKVLFRFGDQATVVLNKKDFDGSFSIDVLWRQRVGNPDPKEIDAVYTDALIALDQASREPGQEKMRANFLTWLAQKVRDRSIAYGEQEKAYGEAIRRLGNAKATSTFSFGILFDALDAALRIDLEKYRGKHKEDFKAALKAMMEFSPLQTTLEVLRVFGREKMTGPWIRFSENGFLSPLFDLKDVRELLEPHWWEMLESFGIVGKAEEVGPRSGDISGENRRSEVRGAEDYSHILDGVNRLFDRVLSQKIVSNDGKEFIIGRQVNVGPEEIGVRLKILDGTEVIAYADFNLLDVSGERYSRMDYSFMGAVPPWANASDAISVDSRYRTAYHGIGLSLMSMVLNVAQGYGCKKIQIMTRNKWFINEVGMAPDGAGYVTLSLSPDELGKLHKKFPEINIRQKTENKERRSEVRQSSPLDANGGVIAKIASRSPGQDMDDYQKQILAVFGITPDETKFHRATFGDAYMAEIAGQKVAIKMVGGAVGRLDPEFSQSSFNIQEEAANLRAAQNIKGVPKLYGEIQTEDGKTVALVREWVEGVPLQELAKGLSREELEDIAGRIESMLKAIMDKTGLLLWDVNTSNFIIREAGLAKGKKIFEVGLIDSGLFTNDENIITKAASFEYLGALKEAILKLQTAENAPGAEGPGSTRAEIRGNQSSVRSEARKSSEELLNGVRAVHVNIPFGDSSIDLIFNNRMIYQLDRLELTPEEFAKSVVKEIQSEPLLAPLKEKLNQFQRRENFIDPIKVLSAYDPTDDLAAAFPRNVTIMIMMREVFDGILYKMTMAEEFEKELLGTRSLVKINYRDYYQNKLTSDSLYEALKGQLLYQVNVFNEIGNRIYDGQFVEDRLPEFQDWVKAHEDQFDIDSKIHAYVIIFYMRQILNENDVDHTLEAEIERLRKLKETLDQVGRPILDVAATRDQKIEALREVLKIDPNRRSSREQLEYYEKILREEKRLREAVQEAKNRAGQMKSSPAGDLLQAVRNALVSNDKHYATALLNFVALRDGLATDEYNMALTFLPLTTDSYDEAGKIQGLLIMKYRQALLNEIFAVHNLTDQERELVSKIYLEFFSSGRQQRENRIRRGNLLKNVVPKLEAMESLFEKRKNEMHAKVVRLNSEIYSQRQGLTLKMPASRSLGAFLRQNADSSSEMQLQTAKAYFEIVHGVSLETPYEEDVDLATRLTDFDSFDSNRPMTLYSKNETPRILKRLKQLDQWLAALPAEVVLRSLSFQKIVIVKKVRAFFSHSKILGENKIVLGLEDDTVKRTLYHELGHSLHGPRGSFAAYVSPERLSSIILQHAESLKGTKFESLIEQAKSGHITEETRSEITWDIFEMIFSKQLQHWLDFNRKIGVADLNAPFKPERKARRLREEFGRDGISPIVRGNRPSLAIEYMFELPFEDELDGPLTRDVPVELIAEHAQLFVAYPNALKKHDPISYDILQAIFGDIHSQTSVATIPEMESKVAAAPRTEARSEQRGGQPIRFEVPATLQASKRSEAREVPKTKEYYQALIDRRKVIRERIATGRDSEGREISEVLSFGDKHGEVGDLVGILKAAKDAVKAGRPLRIIGHGDYSDWGMQNKEIWNILRELKQLAASHPHLLTVDLLLGNHDVFMIQAVLLKDKQAFAEWIFNGGLATLKEFGFPPEEINAVDLLVKNLKNAIRNYEMLQKGHSLAAKVREAQDERNRFLKRISEDYIKKWLSPEWAATLLGVQRFALWKAQNLQLFAEDDYGFLHVHAGIPMNEDGNPAIGREELESLGEEWASMQRNMTESLRGKENINDALEFLQIGSNRARWADFFEAVQSILWAEREDWIDKFYNPEANPQVHETILDNYLWKLGFTGIVGAHIHLEKLLHLKQRVFVIDVDDELETGHLDFNDAGMRFNSAAGWINPLATKEEILAGVDAEIARLKEFYEKVSAADMRSEMRSPHEGNVELVERTRLFGSELWKTKPDPEVLELLNAGKGRQVITKTAGVRSEEEQRGIVRAIFEFLKISKTEDVLALAQDGIERELINAGSDLGALLSISERVETVILQDLFRILCVIEKLHSQSGGSPTSIKVLGRGLVGIGLQVSSSEMVKVNVATEIPGYDKENPAAALYLMTQILADIDNEHFAAYDDVLWLSPKNLKLSGIKEWLRLEGNALDEAMGDLVLEKHEYVKGISLSEVSDEMAGNDARRLDLADQFVAIHEFLDLKGYVNMDAQNTGNYILNKDGILKLIDFSHVIKKETLEKYPVRSLEARSGYMAALLGLLTGRQFVPMLNGGVEGPWSFVPKAIADVLLKEWDDVASFCAALRAAITEERKMRESLLLTSRDGPQKISNLEHPTPLDLKIFEDGKKNSSMREATAEECLGVARILLHQSRWDPKNPSNVTYVVEGKVHQAAIFINRAKKLNPDLVDIHSLEGDILQVLRLLDIKNEKSRSEIREYGARSEVRSSLVKILERTELFGSELWKTQPDPEVLGLLNAGKGRQVITKTAGARTKEEQRKIVRAVFEFLKISNAEDILALAQDGIEREWKAAVESKKLFEIPGRVQTVILQDLFRILCVINKLRQQSGGGLASDIRVLGRGFSGIGLQVSPTEMVKVNEAAKILGYNESASELTPRPMIRMLHQINAEPNTRLAACSGIWILSPRKLELSEVKEWLGLEGDSLEKALGDLVLEKHEYVKGISLSEASNEMAGNDARRLDLAGQFVAIYQFLYLKGYIDDDVQNTGNYILSEDGVLKLIDFDRIIRKEIFEILLNRGPMKKKEFMLALLKLLTGSPFSLAENGDMEGPWRFVPETIADVLRREWNDVPSFCVALRTAIVEEKARVGSSTQTGTPSAGHSENRLKAQTSPKDIVDQTEFFGPEFWNTEPDSEVLELLKAGEGRKVIMKTAGVRSEVEQKKIVRAIFKFLKISTTGDILTLAQDGIVRELKLAGLDPEKRSAIPEWVRTAILQDLFRILCVIDKLHQLYGGRSMPMEGVLGRGLVSIGIKVTPTEMVKVSEVGKLLIHSPELSVSAQERVRMLLEIGKISDVGIAKCDGVWPISPRELGLPEITEWLGLKGESMRKALGNLVLERHEYIDGVNLFDANKKTRADDIVRLDWGDQFVAIHQSLDLNGYVDLDAQKTGNYILSKGGVLKLVDLSDIVKKDFLENSPEVSLKKKREFVVSFLRLVTGHKFSLTEKGNIEGLVENVPKPIVSVLLQHRGDITSFYVALRTAIAEEKARVEAKAKKAVSGTGEEERRSEVRNSKLPGAITSALGTGIAEMAFTNGMEAYLSGERGGEPVDGRMHYSTRNGHDQDKITTVKAENRTIYDIPEGGYLFLEQPVAGESVATDEVITCVSLVLKLKKKGGREILANGHFKSRRIEESSLEDQSRAFLKQLGVLASDVSQMEAIVYYSETDPFSDIPEDFSERVGKIIEFLKTTISSRSPQARIAVETVTDKDLRDKGFNRGGTAILVDSNGVAIKMNYRPNDDPKASQVFVRPWSAVETQQRAEVRAKSKDDYLKEFGEALATALKEVGMTEEEFNEKFLILHSGSVARDEASEESDMDYFVLSLEPSRADKDIRQSRDFRHDMETHMPEGWKTAKNVTSKINAQLEARGIKIDNILKDFFNVYSFEIAQDIIERDVLLAFNELPEHQMKVETMTETRIARTALLEAVYGGGSRQAYGQWKDSLSLYLSDHHDEMAGQLWQREKKGWLKNAEYRLAKVEWGFDFKRTFIRPFQIFSAIMRLKKNMSFGEAMTVQDVLDVLLKEGAVNRNEVDIIKQVYGYLRTKQTATTRLRGDEIQKWDPQLVEAYDVMKRILQNAGMDMRSEVRSAVGQAEGRPDLENRSEMRSPLVVDQTEFFGPEFWNTEPDPEVLKLLKAGEGRKVIMKAAGVRTEEAQRKIVRAIFEFLKILKVEDIPTLTPMESGNTGFDASRSFEIPERVKTVIFKDLFRILCVIEQLHRMSGSTMSVQRVLGRGSVGIGLQLSSSKMVKVNVAANLPGYKKNPELALQGMLQMLRDIKEPDIHLAKCTGFLKLSPRSFGLSEETKWLGLEGDLLKKALGDLLLEWHEYVDGESLRAKDENTDPNDIVRLDWADQFVAIYQSLDRRGYVDDDVQNTGNYILSKEDGFLKLVDFSHVIKKAKSEKSSEENLKRMDSKFTAAFLELLTGYQFIFIESSNNIIGPWSSIPKTVSDVLKREWGDVPSFCAALRTAIAKEKARVLATSRSEMRKGVSPDIEKENERRSEARGAEEVWEFERMIEKKMDPADVEFLKENAFGDVLVKDADSVKDVALRIAFIVHGILDLDRSDPAKAADQMTTLALALGANLTVAIKNALPQGHVLPVANTFAREVRFVSGTSYGQFLEAVKVMLVLNPKYECNFVMPDTEAELVRANEEVLQQWARQEKLSAFNVSGRVRVMTEDAYMAQYKRDQKKPNTVFSVSDIDQKLFSKVKFKTLRNAYMFVDLSIDAQPETVSAATATQVKLALKIGSLSRFVSSNPVLKAEMIRGLEGFDQKALQDGSFAITNESLRSVVTRIWQAFQAVVQTAIAA